MEKEVASRSYESGGVVLSKNFHIDWPTYCFIMKRMDWPEKRFVALMMEIIEGMGLPEKQEEAIKNQLKKSWYQGFYEDFSKDLQLHCHGYDDYVAGKRGWVEFEYTVGCYPGSKLGPVAIERVGIPSGDQDNNPR